MTLGVRIMRESNAHRAGWRRGLESPSRVCLDGVTIAKASQLYFSTANVDGLRPVVQKFDAALPEQILDFVRGGVSVVRLSPKAAVVVPKTGKGRRGGRKELEYTLVARKIVIGASDEIARDANQVRIEAQAALNRFLNEGKADTPGGVKIGEMQKRDRRTGPIRGDIMAAHVKAARFNASGVSGASDASQRQHRNERPSGNPALHHALKAASQSFHTGSYPSRRRRRAISAGERSSAISNWPVAPEAHSLEPSASAIMRPCSVWCSFCRPRRRCSHPVQCGCRR